ncbi:hypothetical protein VNO80_02310 [Phaseolus coccineus]|uniref:Uncharacterized protein n=1 Tax=Phaseolus coccineus TaxID=3886 RepID=A0AAN9NPQ2_PHACN
MAMASPNVTECFIEAIVGQGMEIFTLLRYACISQQNISEIICGKEKESLSYERLISYVRIWQQYNWTSEFS